jgi:ABC-type Mn2+/Zn2+ transport system permease subunit
VGYGLAIVSYVLGLALSAVMDLPSSPVVVWVMAMLAILVHLTGR